MLKTFRAWIFSRREKKKNVNIFNAQRDLMRVSISSQIRSIFSEHKTHYFNEILFIPPHRRTKFPPQKYANNVVYMLADDFNANTTALQESE